jgi:small subunit ribosomal protein S21
VNGTYVREDEPLDKALRRFTKICERNGVLSELKANRHYEKPCDTRKRKMNSAKRRRLQDARKNEERNRHKRW